MARNKYPEETVRHILDVSLKLFLEKGYDNTTIQDIVDHLEVTKGAVYHHFKSKEDILSAALDDSSAGIMASLKAVRDNAEMTGLQKLQALFDTSIRGPQMPMSAAMVIDPDPVKNARLLGMQFASVFDETAPLFVEPVIRQGVQDGSIRTEYPHEMAEVVSLLANLWVNPLFHMSSAEEIQARIDYYVNLLHLMGADIVDDGASEVLQQFRSDYESALHEREG